MSIWNGVKPIPGSSQIHNHDQRLDILNTEQKCIKYMIIKSLLKYEMSKPSCVYAKKDLELTVPHTSI